MGNRGNIFSGMSRRRAVVTAGTGLPILSRAAGPVYAGALSAGGSGR